MRFFSFLLLFACIINASPVAACTTFFINKDGQLVFGKNYDWLSDAGMICTNLKGLRKTSATAGDGPRISYISKYGSITFNQYGKEFPNGGMNDSGLVVELMWAEGTQYPKDDKRPALSVLQWIQYQLDNCATVTEVIGTDGQIRISSENPPLHYLVADAHGNAATIEFFDGKMIVHQGSDLPFAALANSPYQASVKSAAALNIKGGNTQFSLPDNSLQRFATACSMVQQFDTYTGGKLIVDYAFDVLKAVSQSDFTKWSIVYDIKNKAVYFKTHRYKDIKSLSFEEIAFTCPVSSKIFNMNQPGKGSIAASIVPYTERANRDIVITAVKESNSRIGASAAQVEQQLAYPATVVCAGK